MLTGRPVPGDFSTSLIDFVTNGEIFEPKAYLDKVGVPTIGIGYALLLRNKSNIYSVNNNLAADFAGIHAFSSAEVLLLRKIATDLNQNNISIAKSDLAQGKASGLLDFSITKQNAQTLLTDAMNRNVSDAQLTTIAANPLMSGTYELIALEDIAYNGPALVTAAIRNAVIAGDRLTTWYDILNTINGGKSKSTAIEERRISEANEFSLYSGGNSTSDPAEAIKVVRFLDLQETDLANYMEGTGDPSSVAWDFINKSYSPADEELINTYGQGLNIANVVAVSSDNGGSVNISNPSGYNSNRPLKLGNTLVIGGSGNDTVTLKGDLSASLGLGSAILYVAQGGSDTINSSGLTSDQTIEIAPGAGTLNVKMGIDETLKLDAPLAFSGTISGFTAGDVLDLSGMKATSAKLVNNNTLEVNYDGGLVDFHLAGSINYSNYKFGIQSDGSGGTDIAVTPAIEATVKGTILQFSGSGFDATQVATPAFVKVGGAYTLLYSGMPFANNMQIGLATSSDGITWTKSSSSPVISNAQSPSWASFREIPATLMYEGGTYELWFNGNNRNLATDLGYGTGFGLATSTDGINWTFSSDPIRWELNTPNGTGISLEEVVKLDNRYFAYYANTTPAGTIQDYAVSTDGKNFSGDAPLGLPGGYTLSAARVAVIDGVSTVLAIASDASGASHYVTSTDGVNFAVGDPIKLPPNFGPSDLLVENGQVEILGGIGVGNVNWSYGNTNIEYVTAPLPGLQPVTPVITQVFAAPGSGGIGLGKTVTVTVGFNSAVTVKGSPKLNLNDGGTATYTGGSGTSALTFAYKVAPAQNTPDLQVTGITLPTGASIKDAAGHVAELAGAKTDLGLQIDTTPPAISAVSSNLASGDLNAGKTVAISLAMSEPVVVTGTPTLSLNVGGGAATFDAASSTPTTLVFNYKVASGQNTGALMVTKLNLRAGTSIQDLAGNKVKATLPASATLGLQIDTMAPTVKRVAASGSSRNLNAGKTAKITLVMSEPVTVSANTALSLNDGGTATYDAALSSAKALTFDYTVQAGENTTALKISGLRSGSIQDLASNPVGKIPLADLGLKVDTLAPTVSSITELHPRGTGIGAPSTSGLP